MVTLPNSPSSSLFSVTGISMGDEGKGRVVHEILEQERSRRGNPAAAVMKVNGGANAGHTAAGLKLNLLPSGVGNPDVEKLLIGAGVVADPRKFLWEAIPLEDRNISVIGRLLIDEKCQVSDLSHRLLDLAWENYRVKQLKQESRGSTGRGISPAYSDETGQWQIFYLSFLEDRSLFRQSLQQRVQRATRMIRDVCQVSETDWVEFFTTLTRAEENANRNSIENGIFPASEFDFKKFMGSRPFELNMDLLEEIYWEAGQKLKSCIGDGRDFLIDSLEKHRFVVAEFGQAFWLDKRHGFTPNVTASHTTTAELFLSGGIPLQPVTQIGCCKAYDTKVGTHHFLTQLDHQNDPWGQKLAQLEFGTSTGRQRMVGWFDAVEKGEAFRYGGLDELVINKLDALTLDPSVPPTIKICVAYRTAGGQIIKKVPRTEALRRQLSPVYEAFPGWEEDLRKVKSYGALPLQAKEYIARMLSSVIDVAYPGGWLGKKLPQLRFIGVGPDPSEIISDLPTTEEILQIHSNSLQPSIR